MMKNLCIMLIFSLLATKSFAQFMGVNVPAPLYPLHVAGHSVNPEQVIIEADGDHPSSVSIKVNATNPTATAGYSILKNGVFFAMMGVNPANDFFVQVGTNAANAIYARNSDNFVGIKSSNPQANLDVNGTLKLGTNGSVITNIIKVSVTVDVPSIPINSAINQSFTVSNASVGGSVSISPDIQLPSGMMMYNARVSANNIVTVTFRNTSTSVPFDLPSMPYHIAVIL